MHVIAVLTGKPQKTPAKAGMTGHFKTPVAEAVVTPDVLDGDHIMDRKNHGGVDQAVYLFGEDDRHWWSQALDREVPPGFFGENLLLSDLTSRTLCLGDLFTIGDVMLEITSPRIPCATYAAHIGSGQAIKDFYRAERPGAYARVLSGGRIRPGDPVVFTAFTETRIRVVDVMRHYRRNFDDDRFLRQVLDTPAHYKMHQDARARLGLT